MYQGATCEITINSSLLRGKQEAKLPSHRELTEGTRRGTRHLLPPLARGHLWGSEAEGRGLPQRSAWPAPRGSTDTAPHAPSFGKVCGGSDASQVSLTGVHGPWVWCVPGRRQDDLLTSVSPELLDAKLSPQATRPPDLSVTPSPPLGVRRPNKRISGREARGASSAPHRPELAMLQPEGRPPQASLVQPRPHLTCTETPARSPWAVTIRGQLSPACPHRARGSHRCPSSSPDSPVSSASRGLRPMELGH